MHITVPPFRKFLFWLTPALSGILIAVSFPSTNLFFCAGVAFVPLLFLIERSSLLESALAGLSAGAVAVAVSQYWIYGLASATQPWGIALPIFVLFLVYYSFHYAVWALLLRLSGYTSSSLPHIFLAAGLWTGIEYLRELLVRGFMWIPLGASQWNFLPVVQISTITGIYGVSFLVVLSSAVIAYVLRTRHLKAALVAAVALLMIVSWGWLQLRAGRNSAGQPLTVALLQGNIDQDKKWDRKYLSEIQRAFEDLCRESRAKKPDLIVWPETALPDFMPNNRELLGWVSGVVRKNRTYSIIGGQYFTDSNEYYNAAFLFSPDAEIVARHHKTHLVPFGEFIPFRGMLGPLAAAYTTFPDFTPGKDFNVFRIKTARVGALICSENLFGGLVRRFVKNGANVLVSQTDDAWFLETNQPVQHFIINVFRAVENRRPVITCGNPGVCGIIDPWGRVIERYPSFIRKMYVGTVTVSEMTTFYTRYGDVFAWLCLAFSAFFVARRGLQRLRKE